MKKNVVNRICRKAPCKTNKKSLKQFIFSLLIISICALAFHPLIETIYADAFDDSSSITLQDSIIAEDENNINPETQNWITVYNCYAYALGKYNTNTDFSSSPSADPFEGYYIGKISTGYEICSDNIEDYIDGIVSDLLYWRCTDITISTTMPSTTLSDNERLICFRLSMDTPNSTNGSYHFMRYKIKKDAEGNSYGAWYHKPGDSQVLQYKQTPSNDLIWTNEGISAFGQFPEQLIEYNSPIYYIKYKDPVEYNVLTGRYVIDSYEDLNNIRYLPDEHWELTANVSIPSNTTWEPIETFSGFMLGNGHTISGLKFTGNKTGKYGFILTNKGQIQDLNFINTYINITGTIDLSKTITIGVVAAENNGSIIRCNVGNYQYYAEITIMSNIQSNVGAICGINKHNGVTGKIINCHVKNFKASLSGNLGGICGINDYSSSIFDSTVSSSNLSLYYGTAGGIAATNYGIIEDSALESTTISCYNGFPNLRASYYSSSHYAYIGGITGINTMPSDASENYELHIKTCNVSNSEIVCASESVDADHGGKTFAPEMGLISGRSLSRYLDNCTYTNSTVSGDNLTTLTWKGGFLNLQTYSWNQAQYMGNRLIGREL